MSKNKKLTAKQIADKIYWEAVNIIGEANLNKFGQLTSSKALRFAEDIWNKLDEMIQHGDDSDLEMTRCR